MTNIEMLSDMRLEAHSMTNEQLKEDRKECLKVLNEYVRVTKEDKDEAQMLLQVIDEEMRSRKIAETQSEIKYNKAVKSLCNGIIRAIKI